MVFSNLKSTGSVWEAEPGTQPFLFCRNGGGLDFAPCGMPGMPGIQKTHDMRRTTSTSSTGDLCNGYVISELQHGRTEFPIDPGVLGTGIPKKALQLHWNLRILCSS